MSVRKRNWKTSKGFEKEAWVVDYADGHGERRLKTFKKKKDADTFASTTHVEIRQGTHVADGASVTVKEAGEKWIAQAEADELERSTVNQYRQHLDLHIVPFLGSMRLSQLNAPTVRAFEDKLREEGRSKAMVAKVVRSLGSLLADAQEQGLAAHNAVRDLSRKRRKGKKSDARQKGRLKAGVDFPTNAEIKAIIHNVKGRFRPLIITAIFTGLRASELRGLTWADVDFEKCVLHVRQRADRYNQIGAPKSKAGNRDVPLSPLPLNTLREWKLQCPKGDMDLVFPNGKGNIESLGNIINRGLIPAQIAAGVVTKDGKAKYTGMHTLRHFYASWCINRKEDGGIGLPPKIVQEHLGHSSITMTMDVYGHLFPRGDDTKELTDAEQALLA
jgi:integrase